MYLLLILISLVSFSHAADNTPTTAGQKERAVTALEHDVKADPDNAQLWLHLGFAYRKSGKMDDSIHAFEKASKLDPLDTDAFYMLGMTYESKHDVGNAKRSWKNYLSVEQNPTKRAEAEDHLKNLK